MSEMHTGQEDLYSSQGIAEPLSTEFFALQNHETPVSEVAFTDLLNEMQVDPEVVTESEKAVLSLIAECWDSSTDGSDFSSVAKEREWLVEMSLRTIGAKSQLVTEHGLTQYEAATGNELDSMLHAMYETYGETEQSQVLQSSIGAITKEFKFDTKFPGQVINPDLKYMVLPHNVMSEKAELSGISASVAHFDDGSKVIMVGESTYQSGVVDGGASARGLIAHEVGHTFKTFLIGEGANNKLGTVVNELFAEWAGDDKNMYFDEKHFANFLSCVGFNLRKELIPQLARGDVEMPEVIQSMQERFGARNALRILAYTPDLYAEVPKGEELANIAQDCIEYALDAKKATQQTIKERLETLYTPEVAKIVLNTSTIKDQIPPVLTDAIRLRATQ